MTRRVERDRKILKRTPKLLACIAEDVLGRFAPAGLDIGAEGPEEIAPAVVTEIRAVAARRPGGLLREQAGSMEAV